MNEIHVTMRGNVVTDPRHVQLRDGTAVTSFRLACTPRRFDRDRGEWVSRESVYVTVNCWRSLASNVAGSVVKGQPVIVAGRMSERTWTTDDERTGRSIEIEAESVGHDLMMGTAEFSRVVRADRGAGEFRGYEPSGPDLAREAPVEATDVPEWTAAGGADAAGPDGGESFPGQVVLDQETGAAATSGTESVPAQTSKAGSRRRSVAPAF